MTSPKEQRIEGEGNRTADRRYRQGVREHIDRGDIEEGAKRAREAVDGDEGDELRAAEEKARARAAEQEPSERARRFDDRKR